jgi:hypothetical protein
MSPEIWTITEMNTEDDWRAEAAYAKQERDAQRCRCHFEMPGRCPGPAACPMCDDDDETDDT